MASIPEVPQIGKNILALRKKVNYSLDKLAAASGVSKAMISQVEQGKVNPTIATIWKIASGLGVDFNALLGNTEGDRLFTVSRDETAHYIYNTDKTCRLKILTPPQMVDELELYWLTFEPKGALVSEPHFSYTEEILTVIEGAIEVTAADKTTLLKKGDAIRYHADVKHAIREMEGKKGEVILAVYFKESKRK